MKTNRKHWNSNPASPWFSLNTIWSGRQNILAVIYIGFTLYEKSLSYSFSQLWRYQKELFVMGNQHEVQAGLEFAILLGYWGYRCGLPHLATTLKISNTPTCSWPLLISNKNQFKSILRDGQVHLSSVYLAPGLILNTHNKGKSINQKQTPLPNFGSTF